jgi:lipid II:glycine glycyltransferase (peptidoglycan interpeptide bridge formation enzyme)
MCKLDIGYTAEVDLIDKKSWDDRLLQFEDASYYQTWSFGVIHSGENAMSHLVLKKEGRIIGMAQLRIMKIPKLPIGIAQINSGPIYRMKNEEFKAEHLQNMIRALYIEYVMRRGYFLRIIPNKIDMGENTTSRKIYEKEGYSLGLDPGQTVIVDLSKTLAEIRKNMDRKWRQTLQSAEKRQLELVEGNSQEICRMALKIIEEMRNRKGFLGGDQSEAIRIHMELPESQKLRFIVCLDNDEPVAVLGWATIGTVGLPLVAATGQGALKTSPSYVLWWKMIEYYKDHGFLALDMGGVNKRRNPGGYYFKTHILGKRLDEQPRYLGPFDAYKNVLSFALFSALLTTRGLFRNLRGIA